MGRPRGSRNLPRISSSNILVSGRRQSTSNASNIQISLQVKHAKSKKTALPRRRKDDMVGPSISFFPFTKLPKNRVVLQRYFWYREQDKSMKTKRMAHKISEELVDLLWKPSGLPVVSSRICRGRVVSVIQKYTKFKKIKATAKTPEKTREFQGFLSQLCDLSPPDLLDRLKRRSRIQTEWQEDWKWYKQMCTEKQPGLLAGRDKLIEQRIKQQRKRQERFIQKNNKTNGSQATLETVSISDDDGEEEEEEWKPRDRTAPIRKLPVELSNTFDRLQLSYRQRAMAAAHTLSTADQDISKTAVSKSSLHRHAKRTRIEKAQA